MRCTGPGEEEGIMPGQCVSPSFFLFFGFHTHFPMLFLILLRVQLGKALKYFKVSNAKQILCMYIHLVDV